MPISKLFLLRQAEGPYQEGGHLRSGNHAPRTVAQGTDPTPGSDAIRIQLLDPSRSPP